MLYRAEAAIALGIDWMNRHEMCQAIPPAYTQWIGERLLRWMGDGGWGVGERLTTAEAKAERAA
jgi:hypothetical protein